MVGQNSEQGYRGEDTAEFDRGYIVEVQIVDEFQHIYVWRDLTLLFFFEEFFTMLQFLFLGEIYIYVWVFASCRSEPAHMRMQVITAYLRFQLQYYPDLV